MCYGCFSGEDSVSSGYVCVCVCVFVWFSINIVDLTFLVCLGKRREGKDYISFDSIWRPQKVLTVGGDVDVGGHLGDVHIEPILHRVQHLRIVLVAHKGDRQTFGAEATGTSHAMQVGVAILGHVVIEDDVYALNVHATSKQVGGHQDALLEVLELLIALQPTNRKTSSRRDQVSDKSAHTHHEGINKSEKTTYLSF